MAKEKPPYREATTLRMPVELKQELQREADRKGMSFNAYVITLICKAREHQP